MSRTHLSVKELAERWECSREVLYQQVASGKIPALHIGQAVRIPIAAVEQYELENTTGQTDATARRRA